MSVKNYYQDKIILVTGGTELLGTHLVRKLLQYNPASIRILDNNETGLFFLEHDLNSDRLRILIGDVRDKDRLVMALEGVDIVFHLFALNHEELCEDNPFDAVKTNVIGTQNVLEAAFYQGVNKVMVINTENVLNPITVVGSTKMLSERLTISANLYRGTKQSVFSSIRIGNIINSMFYSVEQQLSRRSQIRINNYHSACCFVDLVQAVELIIQAGEISQGREIFIPKVPLVRVSDVISIILERIAPKYGYSPSEIKINDSKNKPENFSNEEIISDLEFDISYNNDVMYVIPPQKLPFEESIGYQIPPSFRKTNKPPIEKKHFGYADDAYINTLIGSVETLSNR